MVEETDSLAGAFELTAQARRRALRQLISPVAAKGPLEMLLRWRRWWVGGARGGWLGICSCRGRRCRKEARRRMLVLLRARSHLHTLVR